MKSGRRWFWVAAAVLILVGAAAYLIVNPEKKELDQTAKAQAPGEFILLPAGEVHYQLVGAEQDPLVVLVHGFSVPSYVWEPTVSGLEKAGYRILTFDLYGRGYSDRPAQDCDIDLFTTQLEDLLEALGIEGPLVVGGLSMGGPVAARFAHLHPQLVEGVFLFAPEVVQSTAGDIFPLNLPLLGEYLMGGIMEPFVLPKLQAADFVHPERFPDWEKRYRTQLQYRGTGSSLLSTIRSLTENDPEEEYRALSKTGLPVLLIWGQQDQTIGRDQVEVLEQILPELQLALIPAVGHLAHYERPDLVNPYLIQFLEDWISSW